MGVSLRRVLRPLIATLVAALSALALTACGRDENGAVRTTDERTTRTQAQAATQAAAPVEGCEAVAQPQPRPEPSLKAPKTRLDASKRWTVALDTSCGTVRIRLDVKENPRTTASFAALVRRGFYDGLTFHRIARLPDGSDFVVQGGDPGGDGSGGPGYSVVEAPPGDQTYERGVVAMAKTQIEEPGTSGSQFFIVTAKDSGLPAEYAVVGRITGSDAAVDRIAAVESDLETGAPAAPVVIRDAKLSSR